MAGKLRRVFSSLTGRLEKEGHHHNNRLQVHSPAQQLADLYRGSFDFVDANTNKKHQLAVSADLSIAIDGTQLPGQIVGITTDALTFLDHYGYELIISCHDGFPVTIYDEAEDQTYTILYPDLPPDDHESAN